MRKKLVGIISLIVLIGISVGVYHTFFIEKTKKKVEQSVASKYKVPLIKAYYGDEKIGEIAGYIMDMKEEYVRDTIVPISTERN